MSQWRARLIADRHWIQDWRVRIVEEWKRMDAIGETSLILRMKSRSVVGVGLRRLAHGHCHMLRMVQGESTESAGAEQAERVETQTVQAVWVQRCG